MRLVIGIPTYNRAPKLERLLDLLRGQIREAGLADRVTLLVSDNASTDGTPGVCARAAADDVVRVAVLRQRANLGFNGNVWALYQACDGDHLWTFSDDDLPLPGAVARVYAALATHRPDVLLFSFVQPPGSTARTFDLPDPVTAVDDPAACARFTCRCPKISLYVYRKTVLGAASVRLLEAQLAESGFAYVSLALSILDESPRPRVAVIAEPQATCDDDFLTLRISPRDFGRTHQMWTHPFVRRHAPELAHRAERDSYLNLLQFLWGWRSGQIALEPGYDEEWWATLHELPAEWRWLRGAPGALVRFALLKATPRLVPRLLNQAAGRIRELRRRVSDPRDGAA